jgi:hypothetical protein
MMKSTYKLFIIFVLFCSCHHPFDTSVQLSNLSKVDLVEYHEIKFKLDTLFDCGGCNLIDTLHPDFIKPGLRKKIFVDKVRVKEYLSKNKNYRLMIYIFNWDSKKIPSNQTVLKRFDISYEDYQSDTLNVVYK